MRQGEAMRGYYLLFFTITTLYAQNNATTLMDDAHALYSDAKAKTLYLIKPQSENKDQKDAIWEEAFEELSEGAEHIIRLEKAPNSSWIEADKVDIQEDINAILENMTHILIGDELSLYSEKIATIQESIQLNRKQIIGYREKELIAPKESIFHTTKAQYEKKIARLKEENTMHQKEIALVKERLRKRFFAIGITLDSEQIDLLVSRIDGNDIIKISLIMDMLKYITSQIMHLMQASQEELEEAKKYYGMHLICLELVVYIQEKYIHKVDKEYLPKINQIITQSETMMKQTQMLKANDDNYQRRETYEHNFKMQKLTYNTAKLYQRDLLASKKQMHHAQNRSKADLLLSQNTYKTVMLSSQLYHLISKSQENFQEISQIQMPTILPFQNEQIRRKYKELTKMIAKE
jgi:hypothetical protein